MKRLKQACLPAIEMFALQHAAWAAKPVEIGEDDETSIGLSGIVVGPVQSGSKADGTFFKAFHLKLAQAQRFDDGGPCGEQELRSLALNQGDMARDKGQRITVHAKVFCQESRTGRYHLADIELF
ncbi:hypothetical protein NK214_13945 [Chromobacterium sp. S0633]|uniref:hypothetical protein n=1 Tax=Chromobacterium sp. S0633 TaxID=2957805 RepID=UPI00209CD96F|nr:hypothetical protein [Chromobacterium sp. S0633]MCP1291295.1 hypothetical protein [Chromobacterium sp. S0633]